MELRAFYLFAFTTFGKVMQRLRSNAIHRIQHRADMATAQRHHATAVKKRAALAWALALTGAAVKAGKVHAAGCFKAYWLLRRKWVAWRSAVDQIQEGRAAARVKLESLAGSMFRSSVGAALVYWSVSALLHTHMYNL